MGRNTHRRRFDRRKREREGERQMSNDWMNDQLRARAGTTVRLGNEANDAIRRDLQPRLAEELGVPTVERTPVPPEPPTTATLSEYRDWLYKDAAPVLDDQGRLPTEDGYTRPAADSFVAATTRLTRWKEAKRDASNRS